MVYDDILLPYDGSDGAAAVLDHAGDLAGRFDATVHALYVADTNRRSVTVVEGQAVDTLVQEGERTVAEAADRLDSAGVDHRTDVVQGNPAPTVVEYAEREGHDLVVMPTHGREGISRYLLGSVSEKVVRLSSVPVMTVRMRPDERTAFPYERVLVPTDGSNDAAVAADHAAALAGALDASIHALSVVDDPLIGSGAAGEDDAASDALDGVAAAAERHGIGSVERHAREGSPAEEILECVEANGIDAVVMGGVGDRGTDRILLGGVAEQTVRSAPVPVVTVRTDK